MPRASQEVLLEPFDAISSIVVFPHQVGLTARMQEITGVPHFVGQCVRVLDAIDTQRQLIGELAEGTSFLRIYEVMHDKDSDGKRQRDGNGVPPGQVAGEKLSGVAKLVLHRAPIPAYVQRGGRSRLLNYL